MLTEFAFRVVDQMAENPVFRTFSAPVGQSVVQVLLALEHEDRCVADVTVERKVASVAVPPREYDQRPSIQVLADNRVVLVDKDA